MKMGRGVDTCTCAVPCLHMAMPLWISCRVMLARGMPCLMPCQPMPCHGPCHTGPSFIHAMPRHATLHAMLCWPMPCHATPCHCTPCPMKCHAGSCWSMATEPCCAMPHGKCSTLTLAASFTVNQTNRLSPLQVMADPDLAAWIHPYLDLIMAASFTVNQTDCLPCRSWPTPTWLA